MVLLLIVKNDCEWSDVDLLFIYFILFIYLFIYSNFKHAYNTKIKYYND